MSEIPGNLSEKQDSISVIDHFSKKKWRKTSLLKKHFKHQLILQDKQNLGESSVITIPESKYLEGKDPQRFIVLRFILSYSFHQGENRSPGILLIYFNYHTRFLHLESLS